MILPGMIHPPSAAGPSATKAPEATPVKKQTDTNLAGYLAAATAGQKKYPETVTSPYSQVMWIQKCIRKRCRAQRSLPVKILDGRDNEVASGPVVDFFRRPNPQMTLSEFTDEVLGHYLLVGECDLVTLEYRGNRPSAVYPLSGAQMIPLIAGMRIGGWQANLLAGQIASEARASILLPTSDVRQVKSWNPYNAIRGLAVWEAARLAAISNYKASVFNAVSLDNNIAVSGVLTAQEISDTQEDQIRAMILARYAGLANVNMPMILAGGLKWEDTAKDLSKMQHVELSKMSREETCLAYDTPIAIFGVLEDANRSNMIEVQEIYYHSAIIPDSEKLSQVYTGFARAFGDYRVLVDHTAHPIAQKLWRNTIDSGKKLFDMSVPVADINARLNLGLPDRPWYQRGLRPMGLVDAEEESNLGPPPAEGETGDTGTPAPEAGGGKSEGSPLNEKALEIVKTKIWERWSRSLGPLEARFNGKISAYLNRQKREIKERLLAISDQQSTDRQNRQADGTVQKADSQSPDDILSLIFDVQTENQKLIATVKPLFAEEAAFGASQASHELGLDKVFGVADPLPQKVMRQRIPKIVSNVDGINAKTRRMVRDLVQEGLSSGETVAQLAQRIDGAKPIFGRDRALLIARTETAGAVSEGRFQGFTELGVPYKSWLSARDGKVRTNPDHFAADKKYTAHPIPMAEPFIVGEEPMMQPGARTASAKNVANCRCCLLPVAKKPEKDGAEWLVKYVTWEFLDYATWSQKAAKAA